MEFYSHPLVVRNLHPSQILWQVNTIQKKIFLTFDDGPSPGVTDEILSLLASYNAKATFFILGKKIIKCPEYISRFLAAGHTIGNHTFSHTDAWFSGSDKFRCDVRKFDEVLEGIKLFRPPFGHLPYLDMRYFLKHYKIIMWSLLSYDFKTGITCDKIHTIFCKKTVAGSIWVFHDTEKAAPVALRVLPALLDEFSERGYTFESISN